MNKKIAILISSVIASVGGLVTTQAVQAGVSANVALTTHYIFRGQDISSREPAIQGGFDYSHANGLYTGIWASSANTGTETDGTIEMDYYIGYSREFSEYGVGIDFGYVQYDYPHTGTDDNEIYGVVSYSFGESGDLSASFWLELDDSTIIVDGEESASGGNAGTFTYMNVGYTLPLPNKFEFEFATGYQTYDDDTDGVKDYMLSISRPFGGVDLALSYSDSDAEVDKSNFFTLTLAKSL